MFVRRFGFVVLCSASLMACHSARSDWSHAQRDNTIAAYHGFIEHHPRDARVPEARRRIATLEDEAAWNAAQVASDLAGYQHYLELEPQGTHAQEARAQVSQRERHAAWDNARQADTVPALKSFLARYPSGEEADEARTALARLESYRAQLATARSRSAADREQRALEHRFGKLLPTIVVMTPNPGHPEYRIASSSMSEQDADSACARLKKARHACEVIRSGGADAGDQSGGSGGTASSG